MPFRYYTNKRIRNSASLQDGVDFDTEARYRREGAMLIFETGHKIGFPTSRIVTAVVYFQRFYIFRSFAKFSRYVTACACLFIAGKLDKATEGLNDIINVAKGILENQKISKHGLNSEVKAKNLEETILKTLKTDLKVEHPYNYIMEYTKNFEGDKAKLRGIAWSYAADSLSTTLPLQWKPEIIAKAAVYLAVKVSNYEEPSIVKWCDDLAAGSEELLEDICSLILYARVAHKQHLFQLTESEESEVTPNTSVTDVPSKQLVLSQYVNTKTTMLYIINTFRKFDLIYKCINIARKHLNTGTKMWQRFQGRKKPITVLCYVSTHMMMAMSSGFKAALHIASSFKDVRRASKWIASLLFKLIILCIT